MVNKVLVVFFSLKIPGRFLIAYRSDEVREPHQWGTIGGAIDDGESPEIAVRRK